MEIPKKLKEILGSRINKFTLKNDKRIYIEILARDLRETVSILFNKLKLRFVTATGTDEKDHVEIIYHFSFDKEGVLCSLRIRLDRKLPQINTISDIVKGSIWIEREIYEMLEIKFIGHEKSAPLLLDAMSQSKKYPLRRNE